jgi:hypothetical protein
MKHKVGVTNALFLCWVMAFAITLPRAVMAATFSDDMRAYDIQSLGWAAIMSLFGGALRTIFTLTADARVVQSALRELWKDVLVAMIAGAVAYIALEAVKAAHLMPVPSEVRFAVIVFAGWSRLSFFGWLNTLGTRVADAITDKLTGAIASSPPGEGSKPKPFQERP